MECLDGDLNVIPYEFGRKFFPQQVNGKINTLEFLEASKGIVKLIDKLGKVFSPLSSDISCNIEKIKKCYDKNPSQFVYIEDLILCEKSQNEGLSIDALLWLRRTENEKNCKPPTELFQKSLALHFILLFFQNIINDAKKNECLQEHMTSAYSQTLEPYHGWVTRKLFKFFKNMVPNRSDLLSTITEENKKEHSKEDEKENLLKFLQVYIQSLSDNVYHIISFYKEHNLDSDAKV